MDELVYDIAKTEKERAKIATLIANVYSEKGYLDPSKSRKSQIDVYLSLPTATTFYAHLKKIAVGTISMIADGKEGLPMDVIFKDKLDKKRKEGANIAEVCQFAIDKKKLREIVNTSTYEAADIAISTRLLGLALHFGIFKHYDFLSLAVNPKHRIFYESVGCIQIGEEKKYPSVNNAPALAYLLDLRTFATKGNQEGKRGWLLNQIFKDPPDYKLFEDG